mmetsp:Transcript_56362/g.89796  ORF Transcript_56362/g.89796 Transcript_56362/m.89796 type:complete len:89 (-) Transcript_56362:548-814(-)
MEMEMKTNKQRQHHNNNNRTTTKHTLCVYHLQKDEPGFYGKFMLDATYLYGYLFTVCMNRCIQWISFKPPQSILHIEIEYMVFLIVVY